MKNILFATVLLVSTNVFAFDLSKDIVASPLQDAQEITLGLGGKGAMILSPVSCKTLSADAATMTLSCGVARRLVYEDNTQDENFGCMFDYSLNADKTYTRTAWECPIL